jgi:hypothetical protein
MNDDLRFARLGSPNVLLQAHAAPDSRYMILPLLQNSTRVTGWTIYDTQQGELLTPKESPDMADGYSEGVWPNMYAARQYLIDTYYREEADSAG